jgi:hypothetical protein
MVGLFMGQVCFQFIIFYILPVAFSLDFIPELIKKALILAFFFSLGVTLFVAASSNRWGRGE